MSGAGLVQLPRRSVRSSVVSGERATVLPRLHRSGRVWCSPGLVDVGPGREASACGSCRLGQVCGQSRSGRGVVADCASRGECCGLARRHHLGEWASSGVVVGSAAPFGSPFVLRGRGEAVSLDAPSGQFDVRDVAFCAGCDGMRPGQWVGDLTKFPEFACDACGRLSGGDDR